MVEVDERPEQREDIRGAVAAGRLTGEAEYAATLEKDQELIQGPQPFDLAVIDIHLGDSLEEAGIEFIRELRARWANCKIIALSNPHDNQAGVRALAYGADDYVSGRWLN